MKINWRRIFWCAVFFYVFWTAPYWYERYLERTCNPLKLWTCE